MGTKGTSKFLQIALPAQKEKFWGGMSFVVLVGKNYKTSAQQVRSYAQLDATQSINRVIDSNLQ